MRRFVLLLHAIWLMLVPDWAAGNGGLAGEWTLTSVSINVQIESWGDYCGNRPKSSSQKMKKPVMVQTSKGHVVIADGTRTDRCGSPNPKIKTVLARRTENRWRRECQTASDDPKFERGVYTLSVINSNRLEYQAHSRFDWTLKGDHCVANANEKRVFIRVLKENAPEPSAPEPSNVVSMPEMTEPTKDTDGDQCSKVGPITKIILAPESVKVGPGERFCFRFLAQDEKGCTIANPNAKWRVTQDDVEIPQLITKTGCFKAGETAADSEGTYRVYVRAGSLIATAQVSVVFEDLGDLFAARLPTLLVPEPSSTDAVQSILPPKTTDTRPAPVVPIAPRPKNRGFVFWVIILGIVVSGIIVGMFVVVGRLRRKVRETALSLFDWPDSDPDIETQNDFSNADDPKETRSALTCPDCGRIYKRNAKYCAYDKTTLVSLSETPLEIPEGMICPKCHRGYEKGARFCPHDSEPLVQYSDWRSTKKPNPKV